MPRYRNSRPFDIIRDVKQVQRDAANLQVGINQNQGAPPFNFMAGSYLSGWVDDTTGIPGGYRLMDDDALLEVVGRIKNAPVSGTVTLFQLPVDYLVASTQSQLVTVLNATNVFEASTEMPRLFTNSSGILTFSALPTATTKIDFHCLFSMDG